MNSQNDPVILFCTTCHSAYLRPPAEVASFTTCLQCQSALGTIERGLGIKLRPGGGNTGSFNAMEDDDDPFADHRNADYAFSNQSTNLLNPVMADEDTDPFGHLPKSVPSSRPRHGQAGAQPQFTEVIDLPSDIQAMARATSSGAPYTTSPMDSVQPNNAGAWNHTGHTSPMGVAVPQADPSPPTDEYEAPATVDFGRITPQMLEQERKARQHIAAQNGQAPEKNNNAFVYTLGCAFLVLTSIAIALIIGLFVLDLGPKNKDKKKSKSKESSLTQPLQDQPFHTRLHTTAHALHPTHSPLAFTLPATPISGEPLLLTSDALWYNERTVTCVKTHRVCPDAKPFEASPWIATLARRLEHRFQNTSPNAPEDLGHAQRWVVVLVTRSTPSRALYETLYTSWERGARLQIATQDPKHTATFHALEVLPLQWPSPSLTGAPSDLTPQPPTTTTDPTRSVLTLHIHPDGLTLLPPNTAKPIELTRHHPTPYPISDLSHAARKERTRHGNISAIHIHPQPNTSAHTLLRTIRALAQPIQGLPEIAEIRLASPHVQT